MHHHTKFHQNWSNGCGDITFNVLKMATSAILDFWKIEYFDNLCGLEDQCVSLCKISSKSAKQFWRYCNFLIFKMAIVTVLNFPIFKFWYITLLGVPMHHLAKFYQNQTNGCGDITFNVFQNGGRPPSWIFLNLNFWTATSDNICQHAKLHQNRSNRCWDIAIYPFFKMAAVCHFRFIGPILGGPQRVLENV